MPRIMHSVLSEEVLEKTMNLFWERGFFNTSVDDIIQVTGFNRAAIYKHFGGKEGLFLAMLQRYRANLTDLFTAPIQKPDLGLVGIKQFFSQFNQVYDATKASRGCLLIATASDIPSHDKKVTKFIKDFLKHLRQLFINMLNVAKKTNEIKLDTDIELVADFLVGNIFGLMTLSRALGSKQILQNQINGIMNFISSISTEQKEFVNE